MVTTFESIDARMGNQRVKKEHKNSNFV